MSQPVDGPTGTPPSGLRNPTAAVRGVGAASLAVEAVVMLMAIVPLNVLGSGIGAGGTVVVVAFAVACIVLAGMLSRPWAWTAASVLQVALLGCGFFVHPSVVVLGVLFGALWLYTLSVRRRVLRS